ncbi:uncharacterized protein LOC144163621 [Haemaphysalis longicornis]
MGSSMSTDRGMPVPQGAPSGEACRVYYWTRPVEGGSSCTSQSSAQSSGSGCAFSNHWMVAFDYWDEVLLCDATQVDGALIGKCVSITTEEFHCRYPKKKLILQCDIPKQFVRERVEAFRNCGRYDLLSNNCQKWIKSVMESMRLDTSRLDCDAETIAFYTVFTMFTVGTVFGLYRLHPSEQPKKK